MDGYSRTKDGYELHFGVNHLGHFLLTNLLLNALRSAKQSRIVTLSSSSHRWSSLDPSNVLSLESSDSFSSKMNAYNLSKLANILFTRQLAALLSGSGITANSVDPGFVFSPAIWELLGHCVWLVAIFLKSSRSGAQTTIAAALDPSFRELSGQYLADCVVARESDAARDDQLAKWLWRASEKLTDLPEVSFENEQTKL